MTFLKKLGVILARVFEIVSGVGPIIEPLLGSSAAARTATTAVNDLTAIGQVVVQVETAIQTPGSGPVKLAAAIPLVANIVKTSELVAGHQIANESLFIQGCTELAQGVVDILNSLSGDNVKSSGSASLAAPIEVSTSGLPTATAPTTPAPAATPAK